MTAVQQQLMECLRAYRRGEKARDVGLCAEDWPALYALAGVHKLTSVVHETLGHIPTFCEGDAALAGLWKRSTILQSIRQAARTRQLLALTAAMKADGIGYVVVKGAVCRGLYAAPDLRQSSDEDLFVQAENRSRCAAIFRDMGFERLDELSEGAVDHWCHKASDLHIELHTALFSTGWWAEAVLNRHFREALAQAVPVCVENGQVMTLAPTDHLLFLIAHAMKHFITGGFGVRTLCDIIAFAETYKSEIDKDRIYALLDQICGRMFFHLLLAVGADTLDYDPFEWQLPPDLPDGQELLEDLLEAGIYGQTTADRKHSGAVSLQAARGEVPSLGKTLFPSAQQLSGRYPVLKKAPWLLPGLWLHRIGCYGAEVLASKGTSSPTGALSLSQKRTEMMKRYGIFPQGKTEDR